ncbi:putative C-type lectin domain family 20 member A isoform X1, partial [Clarias magur]
TKTGAARYIFISKAMAWIDALSYCRQHYTDMASIRDSQENSVVGSVSTWSFSYTGLTRDPWKWSDQTTNLSMITWAPGSAYDYLQNKSCGYFANNLIGGATCSNLMPFYCY